MYRRTYERAKERTNGRKETRPILNTILFSRFPTTDPWVEKRNDLAAATGISTAAATGIAILSLLKLIVLLNPSPAKVTLYKSVGELSLFCSIQQTHLGWHRTVILIKSGLWSYIICLTFPYHFDLKYKCAIQNDYKKYKNSWTPNCKTGPSLTFCFIKALTAQLM